MTQVISTSEFLSTRKQTIESALPDYIQSLSIPESLKESMLYSLEAGGKRLRPVLVLATLSSFGKSESLGIPVGCAIEMIHTYSLIHDDLPCMDDDDLRRGKPTNHKVFGEALAVLAGDGLLTQSFQLISTIDHPEVTAEMKLQLITELVDAAGIKGMVGGQVADMEGEKKSLSLEELEFIHEHKTGKLLEYSIIAGAILAGASKEEIEKLREFSFHLGLAFQIRDDILDIEGDQEKIGKPVGSDKENEKTTYPALLTLEGAKEKLVTHIQLAKMNLHQLLITTTLLEGLCDLIAMRDH
ncbi:polyprenyl synthetase family protein [Metabacillus arenae]|uniref:Farnesyl diphosphate synthase n=1 Tax=Metabacillus arenae TaxID=2771434 RepID=A0A926NCT9_9BACI|nr:farnesyl diphosphate synthase [Metabacillus arenae]MBD1378790.1 polyprenyl synthetase family protein [Metabacillus arenae]